MTKLCPLLLFLCVTIPCALSQTTSPQVITTSGKFIVGPNGSLSYTIGEVVVETISGPNGMVTQGFQQPCMKPPVAVCMDITVDLDEFGNKSISVEDIDNGSRDDCGITEYNIISGQTDYSCSDVGGTFPVVLEVKDANGYTSTCTALITALDTENVDTDMDMVSDVCDNCPEIPNTDQTDLDNNGIGDVCDYQSSCGYTVMAQKEIHMHETTVLSGGVGISDPSEKVKIHSSSFITGVSTFINAIDIDIKGSSVVDNVISPYAPFSLPVFEPYDDLGGDDQKIKDNNSKILSSSTYDKVQIGKNAEVIFSGQNVVYIKELKIKEGAVLKFDQCTNIMTGKKIDFDKNAEVNMDELFVVSFYTEKDIKIKEGSTIKANLHALEDIDIDGKEDNPTYVKGLLVAEKKFDSKKYVTLAYADNCGSPCLPETTRDLNGDILAYDETGSAMSQRETSSGLLNMTVYPNPISDYMLIELGEVHQGNIDIRVYTIQGILIDQLSIDQNTEQVLKLNTSKYLSGTYQVQAFYNDKIIDTKRIIVTR